MPDAALAATERQFLRLIGASNRIAQLFVHPFTMAGVERGREARERVERFYEPFERLQREGLDALIVTGANVTEADLTREAFWEPLIEVLAWGRENVASILCSCLASHAALQWMHGVRRTTFRRSGGGSTRIGCGTGPIPSSPGSTPVSRPPTPVQRRGPRADGGGGPAGARRERRRRGPGRDEPGRLPLRLLPGAPGVRPGEPAQGVQAGGGKVPARGAEDYPPSPENYFPPNVERRFAAWRGEVERARGSGAPPPGFPEAEALPELDNTWTDTGKALVNNWLGLVYQLTDYDRRRPYATGVDPADPLALG